MSIIALIDYSANIYTLLNQRKARVLTKVLDLLVYPLQKHIPLLRYDGTRGKLITYTVIVSFTINHYVLHKTPFLVAELSSYNLILSRKWLAAQDVLPNYRRNLLYWPEDY